MNRSNPWHVYFGKSLGLKQQRGGRFVGVARCQECGAKERFVAWSIRRLVEQAEKRGFLFRIGQARATNAGWRCPMVVLCGKCAEKGGTE